MRILPCEKAMKAVCTTCKEKYEVSQSMEYLVKMGMIPEKHKFICEWCRE